MGKSWKDSLKEAALPDASPIFRHQLPFIGASTIAQQLFCEAKVENEYTMGDIPTQVKDIGTYLHEEIFAMEPLEREELIKHIEESPSLTASFHLYAEIGDLRVAGVPDAVIFEKSMPRWVVELKTTKGDPTKLWKNQEMQVRVYGLLLERMGFDCSNLTLALIRMKQQQVMAPPEKSALLLLIKYALLQEQTAFLEQKYEMNFFLMPHVGTEAENAITWAQDYWLNRRAAIPTKIEGKCRSCEFNNVCAHSLFKPS
jgi:PD-(D/E)XK nuclease superfamily